MQLIEQGKIQLSTPVGDILPELANPVIVTARDADGKPMASTPAKKSYYIWAAPQPHQRYRIQSVWPLLRFISLRKFVGLVQPN